MVEERNTQSFTGDGAQESNPFKYRGRIDNPEHVFGRDPELHKVIQLAGHGENVVVSGPPRIGKSSLLTLVCDRLHRRVLAEDRPLAFPRVSSIDIDTVPDDKALIRAIAGMYREDIDDHIALAKFVKAQTFKMDVYLCVDEYQEIFEPRFSEYMARYLRSLSQHPSLNLIVALDDYKIRLLHKDPRDPEYCLNTFHKLRLSVFKERDVISLVHRMLRGRRYQFTMEHIREICRVTGCHPFKVQLACWHLYNELSQQATTQWKDCYQSEVRSDPSLHRPWDILEDIIRVLDLNLRRSFGKKKPEKEADVADKVETILRSAGFNMVRESPEFLFSVKGYRPDFSSSENDIAIEIKLCKNYARVNKIVEEMSSDVPSYQSRFTNILFVIYDSGGYIINKHGLVNDFEKIPCVRAFVCKQ